MGRRKQSSSFGIAGLFSRNNSSKPQIQKPLKRAALWMDVSDDDNGPATRKLPSKGAQKSPHLPKRAKVMHSKTIHELNIQEQRQQLPIAQGAYSLSIDHVTSQ